MILLITHMRLPSRPTFNFATPRDRSSHKRDAIKLSYTYFHDVHVHIEQTEELPTACRISLLALPPNLC